MNITCLGRQIVHRFIVPEIPELSNGFLPYHEVVALLRHRIMNELGMTWILHLPLEWMPLPEGGFCAIVYDKDIMGVPVNIEVMGGVVSQGHRHDDDALMRRRGVLVTVNIHDYDLDVDDDDDDDDDWPDGSEVVQEVEEEAKAQDE